MRLWLRSCFLQIKACSIGGSVFCLLWMAACAPKELVLPLPGEKQDFLLTSSVHSRLILNKNRASDEIVEFSWPSGSNEGTNLGIEYFFEVALKGNNFSSPFIIALGRNVSRKAFRTNHLNNLLLDRFMVGPGNEATLQFRVRYQVLGEEFEPVYSNMIELRITPYQQLFWILGDATPNGWDFDNPNVMAPSPLNSQVLTFYEVLKEGEFVISLDLGKSNTSFYLPVNHHPDFSDQSVMLVSGKEPDVRWNISEPGPYKIDFNPVTMTISIRKFEPFPELFLVGNAHPLQWNIDDPHTMQQSQNNPFLYTFTANFLSGEFKIATEKGDWCGTWFRPLDQHQHHSITAAFIHTGCEPDFKWRFTEAGNYTITVHQLYERVTIRRN
jgi:starch-binding outer membrane protein SusE/F